MTLIRIKAGCYNIDGTGYYLEKSQRAVWEIAWYERGMRFTKAKACFSRLEAIEYYLQLDRAGQIKQLEEEP